jgi:N-acetyl-anhydromuramyl-L-alanine amidase AmpD
MNITQLLTPYNFKDANRTASDIKYIVIHYVGGTGTAKSVAQYFANSYIGASAHYCVGFEGEIYQSVKDEDIAWHCGAKKYVHPECRNTNSIGIEMCVRKTSKATLSATDKDWYFENATVASCISLVKYLMQKYNIDADHVIRHYDVTGKICPNPYVYNTQAHTWSQFKAALVSPAISPAVINTNINEAGLHKIMSDSVATAAQLNNYIHSKNPNAPLLGELYISEGKAEGVRGDVAFAQSCLETGNFTFKGSAVTLNQNNFAGIGVTKNGMKGNSWATPQLGIRAQIQHLKAYASTEPLKQPCIDERFKYVERGIAPYIEYLGIQENPKHKGWAAGKNYGTKILNILNDITKQSNTQIALPSANSTAGTSTLYRVRKSWADDKTQKGAFSNLANAKVCADKYKDYKVFDNTGKQIYPEITLETSNGFITSKVDHLNLHKTPELSNTNIGGQINANGVYYTVVGKVNGMYKLKSGLYVTNNTDYVSWVSQMPSSSNNSSGYKAGVYLLKYNMIVRNDHSTKAKKVLKTQLTAEDQTRSNLTGSIKSGSKITALEVWDGNNESWMRCSSGWICICDKNKVYAVKQ